MGMSCVTGAEDVLATGGDEASKCVARQLRWATEVQPSLVGHSENVR